MGNEEISNETRKKLERRLDEIKSEFSPVFGVPQY